jgi:hypothetical protein
MRHRALVNISRGIHLYCTISLSRSPIVAKRDVWCFLCAFCCHVRAPFTLMWISRGPIVTPYSQDDTINCFRMSFSYVSSPVRDYSFFLQSRAVRAFQSLSHSSILIRFMPKKPAHMPPVIIKLEQFIHSV